MRDQRPIDSETLARWLDAEHGDRVAEAEAALADLFQALPPRSPRPGFSQRVMSEARLEQAVTAKAPRWAMRWTPVALAAFCGALAWAFVWLRFVLRALGDLWSPAEVIETVTARLVSIHLWLSPVWSGARQVAVIWQTLAEPLQSPPMLLLAGLCLLVAAAALGVLRELVQIDRRWVYVDPI